jgi:hypothetical protein
MTRQSHPSYLRVVNAPRAAHLGDRPTARRGDRALLGFVNMAEVTDAGFERIITIVRPSWTFDLRSVPYFDIGSLDRRRVFEIFRRSGSRYRDVAGLLGIHGRDDASLNSGAVADSLDEMLATASSTSSIVVLVDDHETMLHAMHVLVSSLGHLSYYAMELSVGGEQVLLRSASGETDVFEQRDEPRVSEGVRDALVLQAEERTLISRRATIRSGRLRLPTTAHRRCKAPAPIIGTCPPSRRPCGCNRFAGTELRRCQRLVDT